MVHRRAKVESYVAVGSEGFTDFGVVKGDDAATRRMKRECIGVKRSMHFDVRWTVT